MTGLDLQRSAAPTIAKSVVVVFCAAAVGALVWHLWVVPVAGHYGLFTNGVDTKVYRGGANAVIHGLPLYDRPVYRYWWFTYPPFAAVVMAPLALISPLHAIRLVQAVNIVCLFLLVVLTLRAMGFQRDRRFWLTAVAASLAGLLLEPVHTTIWNGQINLVLAVFVVGCLTLPTGKWRGIGVGIAAGIKLTPIFFVAYLVVTRQFRAALTAVTVFAATILIGLLVLRGQAWRYWTGAGNTAHIGEEDAPSNQSIHGLLARMDALGLWHPPGWLWLPLGIGVAVVGLMAVARLYRAGAQMAAITMAGLTACAVSPFSWGHHWVWILPLLLITVVRVADAVRRDRPITWLWWLVPAAFAVAAGAWRVQVFLEGRLVWRAGTFRVFWSPDAHGWEAVRAVAGSAAYLLVFASAVAAAFYWTRRATSAEAESLRD
ncbi:glycosyltransferase 87 family protein [Gordonia crocea]|uniref:Polyprenol-phosphate-mannose-dependent alpha-(1-2)-phosphatidylinositol mannoside mannosyltransferase n=1 Tax=Gordonia crocea TaxID=589162 RepID=A0A7I9V0Q1_9ACTN|nr:glycosyltransferase 87 family protein [Gordonia crocea]GED99018.1 hypothetical protein nbrc107697_30570 [Gordonia crocea]